MYPDYSYPYPKKAILRFEDAYLDGGTKRYSVVNSEEIGISNIWQDFRIQSTSKGKFYTGYPGNAFAHEVVDSFLIIEPIPFDL